MRHRDPKQEQQWVLPDFENTRIAFSSKSDIELLETERMFRLMNSPWLVSMGSFIAKIAMKANFPLVERTIKNTIFKQFCGGVTLADCQETIDLLAQYNALSILDYGAESKSDEQELDRTEKELINAIEFAASNTSVPVVSSKLTSLVANEILEKKQLGEVLTKGEEEQYNRFVDRITRACTRAAELKVGVFIDAEESWMQDVMDDIVTDLMRTFNRERITVYNTYQMYRHDKLSQLRSDHLKAKEEGYILGAKLVRGAYMNKERARAEAYGYASPIQKNKESTDRDYNAAILYCIDHFEEIALCNASHNVDSVKLMAREILDRGLPRDHQHLNFCQLQGMSDHLTYNLAQGGFNTAKYVVYGPIKEVAAYLIRRAEENTAVTGEMSRELQLIRREIKRRKL